MSFWDHFLPYHVRRHLLPYQFENIWRQIKPHRYEYRRDPIQQLRYALADHYHPPVPYEALLRGRLPKYYRYRHFTIPKKDGTRREIAEPGVDLKKMQYRIIEQYLKREKPHRTAIAYQKGKSIADHAWAHAGAHTVITADMQDFFPSTTRYRVRQFWREQTLYAGRPQFNDTEVQLLTNLTTYRGALPQGAPTSPVLSNLVNRELDARLHKLVTQSGGRYTRYADDMVFSWQTRSRPPTDFEFTVRRMLREYGYTLHPHKGWQVWSRRDEPEFTGVVLTRDGGVDVPEPMRKRIRELERSSDETDHLQLAGYNGYRQMVQRT